MAEGNTPECPVCLVAYTEDGNNTPRILPCYHTACESCVKHLIVNDTLRCPICRTVHEAENEEKSFPQNKDVLAHVRSIREKTVSNGKCDDHGEELDHYCFKGDRRIPICVVCKHTTHKGHDFKGIEETKQQEQKHMLKKLDNIILNIEENIKRMPRYMNIADKHFRRFMRSLDDVEKQLANKREQVMAVRKESRENDEMKLLKMRSQLAVLRNTRKAVEREDCTEQEMDLEAVMGKDVSDWRLFSLFNVDKCSLAEMTKTFSECMSFEYIPIALRHWGDGMSSQSLPKLTVKETITVECRNHFKMFNQDRSATVINVHDNSFLFTNVNHNSYVNCAPLVAVKIGRKSALASYDRNKGIIEFRDVKNKKGILYTHTLAPNKPSALLAVKPSLLLYAIKGRRYEIHWLDLSDGQPKPADGKRPIRLGEAEVIFDLCLGQDGDKQLLIVACRDSIRAYDTETDKLEWTLGGSLPGMENRMVPRGVTTDGRGHLFVTDKSNQCIQMFSVSDIRYIGCLMKDVEIFKEHGHSVLTQVNIRWCERTSSLICACQIGRKWSIRVVHVQYRSCTLVH